MLVVLWRRNVALLWAGQLVSAIGDVLLLVALPYYVYDRTGSALATGAMFIAQMVPRIAFGSLVGVFVDRWDRRWTMVVTDVLRAAVLLILLLAQSPARFWIIYTVAFVQAGLGLFFNPARGALLPRLVSGEELLAANALGSLSSSLAGLVGPPLGGLLLQTVGLPAVVLLDSGSFLVSAAAVLAIVVSNGVASGAAPGMVGPPRAQEAQAPARAWRRLRQEWWEGIRALASHRVLRLVAVAHGLNWLGAGITAVLFVVFLRVVYAAGAVELGWWLTAQGAGGLAAGFVAGAIGRTIPPLRLIAAAYVLMGLCVFAMVHVQVFWFALAVGGVSAAAGGVNGIALQTVFQAETSDRHRGRVLAGLDTTIALATLLGMGVGAALGDAAGVVPLFDASGILRTAAGVVLALMLGRPALVRLLRLRPVSKSV